MFAINNLKNKTKLIKEINTTKEFFFRHHIYYDIPDRYWLLLSLLPDKPVKILDIGPNVHVFQNLLEHQKRGLYDYHSMDIGYNDLGDWAVEHVHDANLSPYPFEENSFDLIIATDVIEHIKNTDVFLQNVYRILKDDGELFITTPNYASIGCILKILQGRMFHNPLVDGINKYCFDEHVKYFTHKDFIAYLNHFGIFPKLRIFQGNQTYLPFAQDNYFKLFFIKYIYNKLSRLHDCFSSELMYVAGKKNMQYDNIYI